MRAMKVRGEKIGMLYVTTLDEAAANAEHASDKAGKQACHQHRDNQQPVLLYRRADPVLLSCNFRHVVQCHANFPEQFK